MEFTYIGYNKSSAKQNGKIQANNEKEVIEFLRGQDITPITIRKLDEGVLMFKKVKNGEIVLFTRQLASMIATGLTLIESLKILKQQKLSLPMHKVVDDLIAQVSEGTKFSDALATYDNYFSDVYVALIRAAEKGGLLDKILARLADNLERSDDLKKRVKSAMFYPGIVITGMGVVIIVMNIFVIPQLGALYDSLNLQLPVTTKIVIGTSKIFTTFYPFIILGAIGSFITYNRFKKTNDGKKLIDKIKLKIPIIGGVLTLTILDEMTRTLSLLITSGASIIESLTITANVAGNYYYKRAILNTSELVEKGVALNDALEHQNIFPPMLTQMVKVGESTGKIDESLAKVAEYFERDLDVRIKTLTTAIEPILIVVLGLSVAFLILSIITPIYGLISQIQ